MAEDVFEKLKQIAEELFECQIVESTEEMDFKQIFGFDLQDIQNLK